jgi:hypothetical protein
LTCCVEDNSIKPFFNTRLKGWKQIGGLSLIYEIIKLHEEAPGSFRDKIKTGCGNGGEIFI